MSTHTETSFLRELDKKLWTANDRMLRVRLLYLAAGLGALWAGLCFYLCGRAQPPVLLEAFADAPAAALTSWPSGSLPSLLHAFAFTALGAACARMPLRAVRHHALGWTIANTAWELLGQRCIDLLAARPHAALMGHGDVNDILFAALGAWLATALNISTNTNTNQHPST